MQVATYQSLAPRGEATCALSACRGSREPFVDEEKACMGQGISRLALSHGHALCMMHRDVHGRRKAMQAVVLGPCVVLLAAGLLLLAQAWEMAEKISLNWAFGGLYWAKKMDEPGPRAWAQQKVTTQKNDKNTSYD